MTPHPNMVWFQGVVENRNDPLELGRVKIRCLGYHTSDKSSLPTDDLPWATPVQPITSAAMNGIGTTPIGPVEGTWVVGFFRDGERFQSPVYFGTLAGIPQTTANPVQELMVCYSIVTFYPQFKSIGFPVTFTFCPCISRVPSTLKTMLPPTC
tara:strand:+ start:536 stop:994 length:459 start_codon:yes stop_codon:yes gene_type:complete